MRIAPSTSNPSTASDASIPSPSNPAPAPVTPAQAYVDAAAPWLVRSGGLVTSLRTFGANTVVMTVADPFVTDPADHDIADKLAADSAMAVLEQAAHGVKLLVMTSTGYLGQVRELAPAQLTFASALPGVQRYDMVASDVNGDGHIAPGEAVHHIEVADGETAARLDWLLRDRFDDGSIQDGPVEIVVPAEPWMPLRPVPDTTH